MLAVVAMVDQSGGCVYDGFLGLRLKPAKFQSHKSQHFGVVSEQS